MHRDALVDLSEQPLAQEPGADAEPIHARGPDEAGVIQVRPDPLVLVLQGSGLDLAEVIPLEGRQRI